MLDVVRLKYDRDLQITSSVAFPWCQTSKLASRRDSRGILADKSQLNRGAPEMSNSICAFLTSRPSKGMRAARSRRLGILDGLSDDAWRGVFDVGRKVILRVRRAAIKPPEFL